MSEAVGSAATGAASGFAVGGPWGAAIGAAAGLLSGLMSQSARKEEEARRRKYEGQMMGLNTQAQAAQRHTESEQAAFNNMVNQYANIVRGG